MSNRITYRYAVPFLMAFVLFVVPFGTRDGVLSAQDNPRISKVCLDCHAGQDSTLAATAHWSSKDSHEGADARVACTDCHAGDRRHWEESPTQFPMPNPSKLDARAEALVCASCHQNAHQQNMAERNVHTAANVGCSGCHSVHRSTHPALLKRAENGLCLDCHHDVEAQFARPYRHPVKDGVIKCSECHTSLAETGRQLSQNGTDFCTKCHAEFQGPFPFEHQATLDHSTEEGGCLSCHEPHGSFQPRMLKQPYEAPHYQLCSQCHSVPRHNSNVMHGTQWAGKACNDCHTDIHGSYSGRLLLRESLQSEGCFNSGCHKF